jgi:drug/metabolite transporter (DMT)-like permease
MPSARDALVLFAIGLVGLLALLALDRSAAVAPVSGAAPALYLHLPFMAAVALVMEGERPSLRTVAAGLLISAVVCYLYCSRSATATPRRESMKERLQ